MTRGQTERWWDFPAAALLFVAMLFASARLAATDWVPHLTYAIVVALAGTALGLALGYSTFGRRGVAWLTLAYTLVVLPWQLSMIIQETDSWVERMTSLGGRVLVSFAVLANGKQVDDYVLFLAFVCILFWGLAIWSGYALARHGDPLGALLPGGLAIVLISAYDFHSASRMGYLAFYLFLGLALFGRLNFIQNRRDWTARRVYLNPEAPTDLSLSIIVSAALVVVLAWNLPVTVNEYKDAAQFWSEAAKPLEGIRQKLHDAFAPVRQPVPTNAHDYYNQNLDLGIGSVHSDAVMFTVQVPPEALVLPRHYWQGIAYDHYENGHWKSTAPSQANFQPHDEYLPLADNSSTLAARYVFNTFMGGQQLLYTPANTVWVSRSSSVEFFPAGEKDIDVAMIRSTQWIASGEGYQARAPVHDPTVADLRQTGEGYPDWVTQNYLQLPEGFSPPTVQLAHDITRDSQTPYDKAASITDYLRSNMFYSERISAPPLGSDPIEWFLFHSKEGFCNYYASAEVLMLRSIGVPARLVAGFSEGEKSQVGNIYTVRDKNAHAWPEVYFPGVGWVEFEPTGNQDPLVRPPGFTGQTLNPLTPQATQPTRRLEDPGDVTLPQGRLTPVGTSRLTTFLVWFVIFAAAVVLFFTLRRTGRGRPLAVKQASMALQGFLSARNLPVPGWLDTWVRWLEMSPIEQSFHAVNQGLTWLGKPQPVYATPAERAEALRTVLPEADEDIRTLLAEQHADLFSRQPGSVTRAVQAGRRVRYQAIRKRLSRFFPRGI